MEVDNSENIMFDLAVQLVNRSSRNIFLTGKAGTGKTTFLKYIRDHCPKQLAVVAPTGVAAINAGGVTIHSFFQLPFTPFVPAAGGFSHDPGAGNIQSLLENQRLTREKRKVIQELELLIIDEISMVRCDVLDAIDVLMRHIRHRHYEQFGGAQVLLIGDMYQLPPVVPEQEWQILSGYYSSPYFFDSKVIQHHPPVHIEFNKIYRQSEERFIQLLNRVRNNEMDNETITILDSCVQPGFRRSKNDGYIILTTHNRKADATNELELGRLSTKLSIFDAEIQGEFSEKAYPADERLYLKQGAQVMFIKNDVEKVRRYYNGKIGEVTRIEPDKIFVRCADAATEIEVKKETWQNIRYVLDQKTRKVDEDVLGSFTQFPLRLAWAITIHKSQGLTFEKAIIDAGEAFAPGQVYVALSRCTSLAGMVLETRVRPSSLTLDNRIVAFSKREQDTQSITEELKAASREYEFSLLKTVYDFSLVSATCGALVDYILQHSSSFTDGTLEWLNKLQDYILAMQDVGTRFQSQLQGIYSSQPFDDQLAQDRVKAAAPYFREKLEECIDYIHSSAAGTDSGQHAKEYNDSLKEIFAQQSLKKHLILGLANGFTVEQYHSLKRSFRLPTFSVNSYGSSQSREQTPHPALYMQLKMLRDELCSKSGLPIYMVAGSNTIFEMSQYLPQTLSELKGIKGFGKARIEKYGQLFLDIIISYCQKKGLSSLVEEKPVGKKKAGSKEPKPGKTNTKAVSYQMFREGKSVEQIATERNLKTGTIQEHLAGYIEKGEIPLESLVEAGKIKMIQAVIEELETPTLTDIKVRCDDSVSFGDIRMVMAARKSLLQSGDTAV